MILGITGKAGHGKNTVANILREICPQMDWQIVAYADKLKKVYEIITGEQVQDTPEWKAKIVEPWGITRRQMFQRIGTEALRNNLHQDVWVRALFAGLDPERNYIITDVRFPNEASAIRAGGGKVIRVVRHGYDNGTPNHASETALDDWYFDTIHNGPHSLNFVREQVELLALHNDWL
jgi:hypothetical protein